LVTNDSTNDENPINGPKIQKPKSGIRKPRGSDIKWSNLLGDQATHVNGYIESPNVNNSFYNCKNVKTTSDAGLAICVSFANEGKTQVRWAAVVG
jgi:hypothetical protein